MPPMQIANWEEGFEIAQSRRRAGRLSWVAMPTRHDSRGYRKLIRSKNGVKAFACWVVMVQVAARCSIRGILADDRGIALDSSDLEAMTDIPASDFDDAFPLLCKIGWLICDAPTELGQSSEQDTITVHNSTNKTVQNITANSSSTYIYKGEIQEAFSKLPENRRMGFKEFQRGWIEIVIGEDIDRDIVIKSIAQYYESGEGQSEFFRNPGTLLQDR